MTYNELVHTLRAIYNILLQEKYIQPQQIPLITIVGSQSILCCYSYTNEIPAELLRSNEIDLFYDPYEDGTEEYEVCELPPLARSLAHSLKRGLLSRPGRTIIAERDRC